MFLILMMVILITSFLLIDQWPQTTGSLTYAGYVSRQMLEIIMMTLFGTCVFFVPAFAAGSISMERERSTWDFLRMSMISPAGVVVAKLINAVGIFFIILLALAPLVSSVFFLVGVDFTVLLRSMPVLSMTIFTCACISLACSSVFRKTIATIGASYGGVVLLLLGPGIVGYMLAAVIYAFGELRSAGAVVETMMVYTSPVLTLSASIQDQIGAYNRFWVITSGFAYQIVISAVCLYVCWRNVRKPPKPPKITLEKPIDDKVVLRQRQTGFPFYILDPLKRKKPIEDRRNPMMVREIRWGLFNRGTLLIRVFYVSLVIYFIAGAVSSLSYRVTDVMQGWFFMQTLLTVTAAPALIANSLTKEYELDNLDMLRMTLMTPKDMILGKFTAGFANVTPLLLSSMLSCIPVLFIVGAQTLGILLVGYANLLACTLLSISIGLFASMCTRQTSTSIMISYGLGFFAFFGLAIMAEYFNFQIYPYDEIIFSPILVLDEVFYRSQLQHLEMWVTVMGCTLAAAFVFVGISVSMFYRYKMQDR